MIRFEISPSMLHTDKTYLICFIDGEKQPRRSLVRKDMIQIEKNNIVRQTVITQLESLCKQRENTFAHTRTQREEAIKAIEQIKIRISNLYACHNMKLFFDKALGIEGYFQIIQPGQNSRYINWRPSFDRVISFCQKCQKHYTALENAKNMQSINNQRVNEQNTEAQSLSAI